MAHKDPHVDHSPDPRVDLCEPCVDLCEPRGDSGNDDPRVARSDPCVAQVFLQCGIIKTRNHSTYPTLAKLLPILYTHVPALPGV